jgi:ADP-heptose:LPS heptosyltransferase
VIERKNALRSFLFVADLNIGDAVIASSAVAALREMFPASEIDLVVKRSMGNIVDGNPDVSNLFPFFKGAPFPTGDDIASLGGLAA